MPRIPQTLSDYAPPPVDPYTNEPQPERRQWSVRISAQAYDGLVQQARAAGFVRAPGWSAERDGHVDVAAQHAPHGERSHNRGVGLYIRATLDPQACPNQRWRDTRPPYLSNNDLDLLELGMFPEWSLQLPTRLTQFVGLPVARLTQIAEWFGITNQNRRYRYHSESPVLTAAAVLEAWGLGFLKPTVAPPSPRFRSRTYQPGERNRSVMARREVSW